MLLSMLIVSYILVILMLIVFWLDATRFIIPNWLVGIVLALYPLYLVASPAPIDWITALGIAVIAFAIGLALFAANVMGGGDVKLLTACCLWVGSPHILDYILYTAVMGGAISILLLIGRPVSAYSYVRIFPKREIPRVLEKDAPLPYGLAIAGGILILLYQQKIPALGLGFTL